MTTGKKKGFSKSFSFYFSVIKFYIKFRETFSSFSYFFFINMWFKLSKFDTYRN